MDNELKEHTLKIPALDEFENSPWPEEHPPEYLKEKRTRMGLILFGAQYQQDVSAMRGDIFDYDDCQEIKDEEYPSTDELKVYAGVDLASDEKERKENARFSIAVIGIRGSIIKDDFYVYLLDFYDEHLRPTKQPAKVLEFCDRHKPLTKGSTCINQFRQGRSQDRQGNPRMETRATIRKQKSLLPQGRPCEGYRTVGSIPRRQVQGFLRRVRQCDICS